MNTKSNCCFCGVTSAASTHSDTVGGSMQLKICDPSEKEIRRRRATPCCCRNDVKLLQTLVYTRAHLVVGVCAFFLFCFFCFTISEDENMIVIYNTRSTWVQEREIIGISHEKQVIIGDLYGLKANRHCGSTTSL